MYLYPLCSRSFNFVMSHLIAEQSKQCFVYRLRLGVNLYYPTFHDHLACLVAPGLSIYAPFYGYLPAVAAGRQSRARHPYPQYGRAELAFQ